MKPTLPVSSGLMSWIQSQGKPDDAAAGQVLLYRWRAWWFDKLWAAQQRLHPEFADRFPERPIWVMGFWRSGTTLLHEMIASHEGISYPSTWQCFHPEAILSPAPAERRVQRPMDGARISTSSPQEDEFVLLALGHPTVYRAFLHPRADLADALGANHWHASEAWASDLRYFLGGCVRRGDRLAIKSPSHLFRLEALQRRFPRGEMIWIYRDPLATWHSNLRMWGQMMERYALWKWTDQGMRALVGTLFVRYRDLLRGWVATGSPFAACIAFEQLVSNAGSALDSLRTRLELIPGKFAVPPPHQELRSIPNSSGIDSYTLELLQEVGALQRTLASMTMPLP